MALLERVATLVRANLNDLVDKAEDPEKMIKQLILDMQNQLLQVKTQVAIAMADHHLLSKKQQEHEAAAAEWVRKAELAVEKKQDDLARAALNRSMSTRRMAESFSQQVADQQTQVENLKSALAKLDQKLAEAQAKSEVLIARHRRSRVLVKAGRAQVETEAAAKSTAFGRMEGKVLRAEAVGSALADLEGDSIDDRFAALEKEDEIERLLAEIKARRAR